MEKKDKEKKVIVTSVFKNSVKENLEFLSENIPDYAERFIDELAKKLRDIARNPQHYPAEPKLNSKLQIYRYATFMKFWKILFKSQKNQIVILKLIHIRQNPKRIKYLHRKKYD